MITILLIRHGIAEDPKRGVPDSERPLTAEGWEKTRAAMKGLVRRGYVPTRAVSSPFKRAAETLVCLKEATTDGFPVGYWEGLIPEGKPRLAEDWLRAQLPEAPPSEILALVSHQPFCSELTRYLTGQWVDFKKSACTVIHFDGSNFTFGAHFTPAELRADA
jgi:phosphohistidine phosphatase